MRTFGALLLVVCLLGGCGLAPAAGRAPAVSPVCAEAAAARQALGEMQATLRAVQVDKGGDMRAAVARAQGILDRYGARAAAAASRDMRARTASALAAGVGLLQAFARGGAGQAEAALYLQLLDAATADIAAARRAGGCP